MFEWKLFFIWVFLKTRSLPIDLRKYKRLWFFTVIYYFIGHSSKRISLSHKTFCCSLYVKVIRNAFATAAEISLILNLIRSRASYNLKIFENVYKLFMKQCLNIYSTINISFMNDESSTILIISDALLIL